MKFSPLHVAAAMPSVAYEITNTLVEQQQQRINDADRIGLAALHWAARWSDVDAVRTLLEYGADPNSRANDGMTPLFSTCSAGSIDSVHALLEMGADVDVTDIDGRSVLHYVGSAGVPLVATLSSKGADITRKSRYGRSPITESAVLDRRLVVAEMLHCISHTDLYRSSFQEAMLEAISFNSLSTVRTLLQMGATEDLHGYGNTYSNPLAAKNNGCEGTLHLTALYANIGIMELLTAANLRGVDAEARNIYGITPDDCFYNWRDEFCMIERAEPAEEEAAWYVCRYIEDSRSCLCESPARVVLQSWLWSLTLL